MRKRLQPIECVNCGTVFQPKSIRSRYCSDECRKEYLNAPETRTCVVCYEKFQTIRRSNSCRCPTCRGRKHISAEIGVRKTKRCRFTANIDNTPDGAKKQDMWLGEMRESKKPKPVKAKLKGRKLPKAPYPAAHVREIPLHIPNDRAYQIKPSKLAYTPEQDAVIREMFDEGATWDEIGEEFGKSADAVRRHAQVIFGGTLNRRRKNEPM